MTEPMRQGDKRRYHEELFARLELIRMGQDALLDGDLETESSLI